MAPLNGTALADNFNMRTGNWSGNGLSYPATPHVIPPHHAPPRSPTLPYAPPYFTTPHYVTPLPPR